MSEQETKATAGTRPELSAAKQALREARLRGVKVARVETLAPRPREGAVPLSFAQERLWFLDQLAPGDTSYNLPAGVRLPGGTDEAVLERAVAEVVRRHEVLRTTFGEVDGVPVQIIAPFKGYTLPVEDLTGLPEAEREAEVRRFAAVEATTPFDLASGPLFRARLLRLAADEHVLLACLHHIVTDGWSNGVLFREVGALYDAYKNGLPSPLPPLPVQYADYALWQREPAQVQAEARQLAYWKERLAGAPELLPLPTDHPRSLAPSHRGASVPVQAGPAVLQGVRALARAEGATPFMVMLAAFQVLLSRYAATEDVVLGTPVAGRTRREVEGLIGLFVNTVVLRADLAGDPSFRTLVGRVRRDTLNDYAHQDLPFERLVAALQPERSLDHAPLFQVLFQMDNAGVAAPAEGDDDDAEVESAMMEMDTGTTAFDLRMLLHTDARGVSGRLHYATDLWGADTVRRMAGHFAHILEQAAADPDRRLSTLEVMDAEERARVVDEWNRTDAGYPPACIHDLFAAQAARTPDAVAVVWGESALTYRALDEHANRLAHHLAARGVGPEARVGICLPRGLEMVVSLLAVLKAGGAYVPLDPAYPAERLGFMVEDAGVRLVLTLTGVTDRLPAAAEAVCLDAIGEGLAAAPAGAPESGVRPENLSHVIFTSGSTGRPKGVMIRHSSVAILLHWLRDEVSDEERASVLGSTSINFDVSVAEIFGTLCWGGKLVLVENALDLPRVADQDIRLAVMVPTAAAELLHSGGIPAGVRRFNLAGEDLPGDLARALYRLPDVVKVVNLYGPTEDTTYSTCAVVERGADRVLIGRPLANTRTYVLDERLRPVPVGVIGDLYLAGDGLAVGYARQPGLTAERFIPDPFGAPGARMYRAMDLARWTAGGALEYFGRSDFQVKVRGFRIEPGEIETALRAHPAVTDAVAVVRADATGDRRLVAYVVPPPGREAPSPAELRSHVRAHLPEYMVPYAFVAMAGFPRTSSGKLDRKALPAPDGPVAGVEYVEPRTETEHVVAGIWADILGVARVGAHDDFFALGGHSLRATRVVSHVNKELGVDVPLRALFETPTLAGFAEQVERAAPAREAPILTRDTAGAALAHVDELSEAELDRLLAELGTDDDEDPAW
jgi:amino acid adenylation domain-containing protein